MTRVLLTRAHSHAGTSYRAGDAIDVDAASAHWLIAQGVAEVAPEAPNTPVALAEPRHFQRKESKQ